MATLPRKFRLSILMAATFFLSLTASAREPDTLRTGHSLRLSVGDQFFESLIWQNPQKIVNTMPESYRETYKEHYRYTMHWAAEYQWRVNSWFSLGALIDGSACLWDDVTRNGAGVEVSRTRNRIFANLTIMPTVRFDWFTVPVAQNMSIGMYTGLGVGVNINGGTEKDPRGKKIVPGLAVDLRLVSLEYTVGNWGVSLELGGLTSLKDKNTIFMAFSKMIDLGVSYKF